MIYGIPTKWVIYGVIGVAILGALGYVRAVIAQRDNLKDRVANLEQALKLERATYEENLQQWQSYRDNVDSALQEANRQRMMAEGKIAGLQHALEVQQRISRERGAELEQMRSAAIDSQDCCEVWKQFLSAVGWVEGDL